MNRPIYFFEFKSPDKHEKLSGLMKTHLQKINCPEERMTSLEWAVYVNDRLVSQWGRGIRPRSKVVVVDRNAPEINLIRSYESSQLVVFDKPAGLPTQKTLKTFEDNLYDQARLETIQKKQFPVGLPYVGLHHRLDRGTSGLVLMTKQRSANKEISELFKNRKITKEYHAYCEWGEAPLPKRWREDGAIRRGSAKKKKFFFQVHPEGDSAISEFEVLEEREGSWYKLVCFPKTGRTHQLRVHLAHKGHPILGDAVYGVKKSASRLMLHAQKLNFSFKGEKLSIESKWHLLPDGSEPGLEE